MSTLLTLNSMTILSLTGIVATKKYTDMSHASTTSILIGIVSAISIPPAYLALLSIATIPWTQISLLPLYIASLAYLMYQGTITRSTLTQFQSDLQDTLSHPKRKITPILITILLIGVARIQLTHDFIHADAVGIWFSKGTIMFHDQHINLSSFQNPQWLDQERDGVSLNIIRPSYPLLVPLNISFIYTLIGTSSIHTAKILWLLILFGQLLTLHLIAKTISNNSIISSLLITSVVLLPDFLKFFQLEFFGYADPWLMFLFGLLLVLSWDKPSPLKFKAIVILTTIALMTKIEAIVSLGFLASIILTTKFARTKKSLLMSIVPPLALGTWMLIARQVNTLPTYAQNLSLEKLYLLPDLFLSSITTLSNPTNHHIIWIAYFITIAWMWLRKVLTLRQRLISTIPLLSLVFYAITYAISPFDPHQFLQDSIHRYAAQWILVITGILMHTYSKLTESSRN